MEGNPWIQKVAGIAAGAIVTYAAQKGLALSAEQVTAVFVTVLTVVEFFVARKSNPGNAVSRHLATKEKAEVVQLKAADR